MLDECPTDRCSLLWPKSDVAIPFVDEVVHLLRDDVGRFSHSMKYADVLEKWSNHLPVTS